MLAMCQALPRFGVAQLKGTCGCCCYVARGPEGHTARWGEAAQCDGYSDETGFCATAGLGGSESRFQGAGGELHINRWRCDGRCSRREPAERERALNVWGRAMCWTLC